MALTRFILLAFLILLTSAVRAERGPPAGSDNDQECHNVAIIMIGKDVPTPIESIDDVLFPAIQKPNIEKILATGTPDLTCYFKVKPGPPVEILAGRFKNGSTWTEDDSLADLLRQKISQTQETLAESALLMLATAAATEVNERLRAGLRFGRKKSAPTQLLTLLLSKAPGSELSKPVRVDMILNQALGNSFTGYSRWETFAFLKPDATLKNQITDLFDSAAIRWAPHQQPARCISWTFDFRDAVTPHAAIAKLHRPQAVNDLLDGYDPKNTKVVVRCIDEQELQSRDGVSVEVEQNWSLERHQLSEWSNHKLELGKFWKNSYLWGFLPIGVGALSLISGGLLLSYHDSPIRETGYLQAGKYDFMYLSTALIVSGASLVISSGAMLIWKKAHWSKSRP